ncbi:hypothetical protein GF327_08590 [Candidatus Woesearchaeota archaeon]|nr:hypothetical protein [Candidatus Woesearchaeota archaeon]
MTKIGISVTIKPETLLILRKLMRLQKKKKSHVVEEAILKYAREVGKDE